MDANINEFLYVEKYRPRKLADCILPRDVYDTLSQFVQAGDFPNLLLTGSAGLGKTTVARALCEELGADYLFVNASEQNGIDMLRTTIRDFASTVSLNGAVKVVILDEADYLSAAAQPALRGFVEEFSKNCRFIYTCNFKNKILNALHSRTAVVEFKISKEDKPRVAGQFFKRVCDILTNENITFDKKAVAELVQRHFPDFRRTLNELQRYAASGTIGVDVLAKSSVETIKELITALREKDFKKARSWVVANSDIETNVIIRLLYDNLTAEVNEVPQLILILADCQKHVPWVADQEIHLAACLLEIMASVSFKDA